MQPMFIIVLIIKSNHIIIDNLCIYIVGMSTISHVAMGKPKLRKMITLTSDIEKNWYKLGMALQIPVSKMETFYGKYRTNPMKALNRVYCYWLSDKNGLLPTWEKLCSALREIKQFSIAADVEQNKVSCIFDLNTLVTLAIQLLTLSLLTGMKIPGMQFM